MKTNSIPSIPSADRIYAALDLHCGHSVLGSMAGQQWLGTRRFATSAENLKSEVAALGGQRVWLTLEASAFTRWAVGLLRPLVGRLVVCDPRHNRLIHGNRNKNDEQDVKDLCLLLGMNKLKEVWMGDDRARQIHRELVYELLNKARRSARTQGTHQGALPSMGRLKSGRQDALYPHRAR